MKSREEVLGSWPFDFDGPEEAMIVLHKDSCPHLCQRFLITAGPMVEKLCEHDDHACDCNPPSCAQLKELVEAAENHLKQHGAESWHRLDAALVPFRAMREELE